MKTLLISSFRRAAWAPFTVFVFYAVAAKIFNAYIRFPWLDMPTHFAGGIAMAYLYLIVIRHAQMLTGAIPLVIQGLLSVGLTAVTAILWEFLEYLSDIAFGTMMNLGVADTLSDLFFGLSGACLLVVALSFFIYGETGIRSDREN